MYKIAILGCENSHATSFLNYIYKDKKCTDIEVLGVFSEYPGAAEALSEKYGVYSMKSYDEFTGQLDGLLIVARHGGKHYQYAKPYFKDGIPMFIDKPITVTEEDAALFKKDLIDNNIKVCGGSMCVFADTVEKLSTLVKNSDKNEIYGGFLRAPMEFESTYGGFFFYTQHLAEVTMKIFGYYPNSVKAFKNGDAINCTLRYDDYDVNMLYGEGANVYSAQVCTKTGIEGGVYSLEKCFDREFMTFYNILTGNEQAMSYDDIFAPVYVLNAVNRSVLSGKEEKVNR